jgi:hypothetical protein
MEFTFWKHFLRKMMRTSSRRSHQWALFLQATSKLYIPQKELKPYSVGYVIHSSREAANNTRKFETGHEKLVLTTPHEETDYADSNGAVWESI